MGSNNYGIGDKILARFNPKHLDTLRECYKPIIGQIFEWECCGAMEKGVYAGQSIWFMCRHHLPALPNRECGHHWIPIEDLEVQLELQ